MEQIIEALKRNRIPQYRINEVKQEQLELFFIRRRLDMRREKEIHKYYVSVYHEFEKDGKRMLGTSQVGISEDISASDLDQKLKDAYFAAGFVNNPYYELPSGTKQKPIVPDSRLSRQSLEQSALIMTEAIFAEDILEDVFLNSAELFVCRESHRIVTSCGIDVSYQSDRISGEFVVQCTEPQDVETYQDFYYYDLETEALRAKVAETIQITKARAYAASAPVAGTYSVLLSGSDLKELLQYYIQRSEADNIYPKYSNYKVGTQVQGDSIKGECLNLTLKARLPYSGEGILMKDRVLLKDGILQTIHGSSRYAYYLGIEPTGDYSEYSMPPGSRSLEELKQECGLHVINFSDFQMDFFTGHFGGEIRFAYYNDGTKLIPVTGGSISGTITDLHEELEFSTEIQKEKGFEGPYAVLLKGVKVAGC